MNQDKKDTMKKKTLPEMTDHSWHADLESLDRVEKKYCEFPALHKMGCFFQSIRERGREDWEKVTEKRESKFVSYLISFSPYI